MKRNSFISLLFTLSICLFVILSSCKTKIEKVIYLENYITRKMDDDIMPALRQALEDCKIQSATKLILPQGHLKIKRDFAYERYCFVSNNDEGLKRIAFDLSEMKDFEIQGNDTHLDFVGYIVPFLLNYSENVTVSGIYIDYTTTFHSEGEIKAVNDEYVDIQFDEKEFPYEINNGLLYFSNKPTGSEHYNNMLEFDKKRREPGYYANDNWINGNLKAEKLDNGDVRIYQNNLKGNVGNIFVFDCDHRKVPGFIISDSKGILIKEVNVYHAGGMAFIAQRSADIELNHVAVTPAPGKNRIVSVTADATHFSNCAGYIKMIDCLFENQEDDATNIHGIYCIIKKIINPSKLLVKLVHLQQYGFFYFKPNMNIEIVDNKSLIHFEDATIQSVNILNKEYIEITLKEPISADVEEGFVIAQIDDYPEVLIKGCIICSNRARGLLIGSRNKVVIDSNYFHVPGSAIYFEGDGSYWYEQSGVRDVEITHNVFDNCNYGSQGWGKACICVGSGIWEDKENSRYHKNIKVYDNIFKCFDPRIINIYCVDGFDFYDNIIIKTNDYQYGGSETNSFLFNNCSNIRCDGYVQ